MSEAARPRPGREPGLESPSLLTDTGFLEGLRRQMLKFATLQLSDSESAEDAVQEALVGALRNASVDWRGLLDDCDFNRQPGLAMPGACAGAKRPHLRDLLLEDPEGRPIRVADHCYGCTAGQGSGCGGALHA